jgi:N-methylhydantoinase A/oxoprolinase/acetone carboxylase beta subunit
VLDRWPAEGALSPQEERIIESLHVRPHSRATLARECGVLAPELLKTGRLEKIGLLRRSAVTPTDALHVLGEYAEHETEAAELGLRALGRALGLDEQEAARTVRRQVARRLAMALMRRELSIDEVADSPEAFDRFRELLELSLDRQEGDTFRLRWEQLRPVVGIGAPVAAYLPEACRLLGTRPIVPRYAEVANAVGAVVSKVVVRATVRVRPGRLGNYVFYAPDGRREFPALPAAVRAAREHVVELARSRASRFGTTEKQVRVDVSRRTGRLRDGSTQLLEVAIEGTLTGAPVRDH